MENSIDRRVLLGQCHTISVSRESKVCMARIPSVAFDAFREGKVEDSIGDNQGVGQADTGLAAKRAERSLLFRLSR